MPLIAYYKEVGQESPGRKTYMELLSSVVVVLVGFPVFEIMAQSFNDAQPSLGLIVRIVGILLLVAVL